MTVILAEGRFLTLLREGRWEFVRRRNARAVVAIIAVTPDDEVLLVEQHRVPVGAPVIELPAGLVGDEGEADEPLERAAARELEEECGWRPARCRVLQAGPSSAGLSDEVVHLVLAEELTRTGPGGGVAGEAITVHAVPRRCISAWLVEAATRGSLIDHKVQAALWWLERQA